MKNEARILARPTADRIRVLFVYEPETGLFRWRVKARCRVSGGGRGVQIGDIAGSKSKGKRWRLKIDGQEFPAAVIAVVYMTGLWPSDDVDHRDRDPMNNRWGNLREATRQQNLANMGGFPHSSRFKGVSFDKQTGRWRARIRSNGKLIALGRHSSEETAHAAYLKAAQELFGEFARAA